MRNDLPPFESIHLRKTSNYLLQLFPQPPFPLLSLLCLLLYINLEELPLYALSREARPAEDLPQCHRRLTSLFAATPSAFDEYLDWRKKYLSGLNVSHQNLRQRKKCDDNCDDHAVLSTCSWWFWGHEHAAEALLHHRSHLLRGWTAEGPGFEALEPAVKESYICDDSEELCSVVVQ